MAIIVVMAILKQLTVRVGADTTNLTAGLRTAAAQVQQVGQSMQRVGTQMSAAITLPLVAMSAVAGNTAAQFQAAMIRVQALSQATGSQLQALTAKAREMGATTKFTASDAAEALGFMSMAGMRASQSLAALPGVLQLAASAGLSLGESADIVTNVLSGYRMQVEDLAHVNDVLVSTFTATNTSLGQLGEAMKYAGPVASAARVQFEVAAAAIGLMGNAGIQGSMAGTSLRGAIARLVAPTQQVSNAMAAAGIEVRRTAEGGIDLVDMFKQLESHANDAGLFLTLFGQRAGPGMAAIVAQGGDALDDLITRLEFADGTAARVADSFNEGLQGAMFSLQSAVEGAGLAFANSGLIDLAEQFTRQVVLWFRAISELNPVWLRAIALIAGVAAAIGPLLVVGGGLLRLLGALKLALLGPTGLVVLLGGLVVALAAATWFNRLKAEADGLTASMNALREPSSQIEDLNRRIAEGADDAAHSLRDQRDANLELMRVESARAVEAAHQASLRAQAPQGAIVGLWNLGHQREINEAVRTRAQADASQQAYFSALTASSRADDMPARIAMFQRAQRARAASRANGVDATEWARQNPDLARALADREAAAAATPARAPPAVMDADVSLTDAGGSDQPLPSVARAHDLASLNRINEQAPATSRELDRLRRIEEGYNASLERNETLTRADVAAQIDAMDAAQNLIDARIELGDATEEAGRHEANLAELQAAMGQGEHAYNVTSAALELMARNTHIARDEAFKLAEQIVSADERMAAANEHFRRFNQFAQDLGSAFANAFERAIFAGDSLGEVFKSLARDVVMLIARLTIVEPLARSITNIIRGGGGGGSKKGGLFSAILSTFAGGFAEGGTIPAGKWGVVGERGPEIAYGGTTGNSIMPMGANNNLPTVDARAFIDARGADPSAIARLQAQLAARDRQLPSVIAAQIGNLRQRGRM